MFFSIHDYNPDTITYKVYEFMSGLYPNLETVDIEVITKDLTFI